MTTKIINSDMNQLPQLHTVENIPHITKYMGSKRSIIDFVIQGIEESYLGGYVCDLFAGSSVLSGCLRNSVPVISNDIQEYSAILANLYLSNYNWDDYPNLIDDIIQQTTKRVFEAKRRYPHLNFSYDREFDLDSFNSLEKQQQDLIEYDFSSLKYHLFIKNYSGTYWSYEQCLWIDSFRGVADNYKNTPLFYPIIASLMFAMSYNSQSTGHYAQYRDANTIESMNSILIYRRKEILPFFIRKFKEFQHVLGKNDLNHKVVSMDYRDCLDMIEKNTTVYADPPYCFVHYSRFYHALETLVKYDYPDVRFKGRYRTDRHQSPFCIQTKVRDAFRQMFIRIKKKDSNLVLSYSNTGMISLDELEKIAHESFGANYSITIRTQEHLHSTMGRKEDKNRTVQEAIVLVRKKN
ncbi:DNA adenine methylase [Pseudogracilibacillus sp. SE30717A]|uniref:DNA adenine methylase n=1 Tax=Pseudogracilibacillus sp. SE30717A TaxID=3098293 RepID=UPI00300E20BF